MDVFINRKCLQPLGGALLMSAHRVQIFIGPIKRISLTACFKSVFAVAVVDCAPVPSSDIDAVGTH